MIWPRSLFGRLALILFLGLAAAHGLTFWLVLMERADASWTMMVSYLARDVASSVGILDRLPADERAAWLARLERNSYRYELGARPPPHTKAPVEPATQLASAVGAALGPGYDVTASGSGERLALYTRLGDGTPVTVRLSPPRIVVSGWVLATLAGQLALLGLFTWIAVRLATRPLSALAQAAEALGPELTGKPLPEKGPLEVAHATAAFNAMQRRIADHLAERMQILAAVSHDLQTPITRMRLRADLLDSADLREKLHGDLAAMQALVQQGIAYARSAAAPAESPCRTDLHALLDSLVCDYVDMGHTLRLVGEPAPTIVTRPQALRRLLANLVDNALKFATDAEIAVAGTADGIAIVVRDRGPGIAPGELRAVLQPFYRLEASRNRETGGSGLGLAIADQLATTLGGSLTLANREGGGLEARLLLPVAR